MRHEFYIAGIFFVLPCIESYQKVDLRTITMGVPPQEVSFDEKCTMGNMLRHTSDDQCLGSYKGLRHCVCWCCGLLQVPTNLSSVLKKLCSSNTEAHQNLSTLLIARVSNATVSVANVEDCHSSTRLLAQVGLMICSFIGASFSSTPTSCSSDDTAEHPWHKGPAPNPERPGEHLNFDAGGQTTAAFLSTRY